ncbi:MAG TPA: T9SS type A sorting domain-containing protein, partial [Candidatus Cloacimonas sp.]|nr:T9SS type A sorting domain-containing protein [Candidatus Cloacimonas sp.]
SLTLWDDIYSLGSQPYHYKFINQPSDASFMVMDADNILFWQLDGMGSAVGYVAPTMGSIGSFDIPVGQNWFAFMDNSHHHRNSLKLSGAMIYESYGSAVQDANEVPQALRLLNAYPNPFSSNMTLDLYLAKRAELKVSIYNLKGQVVKSWKEDTFQTGRNTLDWDATSDDGSKVASGVYIWKVQCGKEQQSCKVLLAK